MNNREIDEEFWKQIWALAAGMLFGIVIGVMLVALFMPQPNQDAINEQFQMLESGMDDIAIQADMCLNKMKQIETEIMQMDTGLEVFIRDAERRFNYLDYVTESETARQLNRLK